MISKIHLILQEAIPAFKDKAIAKIKPGGRTIPTPEGDKCVDVTDTSIKSGLRTICPRNIESLVKDYQVHFDLVRSLMPLSSSPQAFRTAWDLRSQQLSVYDIETLIEQGAQLIPQNSESRVFYER